MNILTYLIIRLIKFYKCLISPFLGNNCRYFPTCSDYSIEAFKNFDLLKGLYLSFKRILSFHPWSDGGFDPLKKEIKVKK